MKALTTLLVGMTTLLGCTAQVVAGDPAHQTDAMSQDMRNVADVGQLPEAVPSRILFVGNSLTHGTTTPEAAYPAQTMKLLGATVPWQNLGHSGETTPQMAAEAATLVDVQADATRPILVMWEGTNDLESGGATPDAAYQHLRDYCAARRAAGFRVVLLSILPVWAPGWNAPLPYNSTKQLPTNELLRAHWSEFADRFVDVGALPQFQSDDKTYYNVDGLHLTDAGYAVIASVVAPTLREFVQ